MGFTMTAREIIDFLVANGFQVVSQKGSHVKMTDGQNITIVPSGKGDLPPGTLTSILLQSGLGKAKAKEWKGQE